MARARQSAGLSDLEEEFELELEDAIGTSADEELNEEFEADDGMLGELDEERESVDEEFDDREADAEFEGGVGGGYAERLMELSTREFESEAEMETGLNEVFDDMHTEYFLGSIRKLAKRGLKAGARNLLKRVKRVAGGLPMGQALKGILASRNLTDLLKNVAKTGLKTALQSHPALGMLSQLGGGLLKQGEYGDDEREAFEQVVALSREAYEHLAQHLDETSVTPAGASQQAADALKAAVGKIRSGQAMGARAAGGPRRRTRVIRLKPNQKLVIIG